MKYLSEHTISVSSFKGLEAVLKQLHNEELEEAWKPEAVGKALLHLIEQEKESRFLLVPVLEFIDRVHQEKIIEHYTLAHFELWLNQFSGLSYSDNYRIRGCIMGKFVPRDEYQIQFPVGMGKLYPGSHYVTAHSSPDLDTTVASFWGWVDAFSARVGEGLHLWNVPGGPPVAVEIDLLFVKIFGPQVFSYLAKTRSSLALSSMDLMSQKGVVKKQLHESTLSIDHERAQNAIIVVDPKGYYIGDWRNIDVEGVRQIIMVLNHCMRCFENNLHVKLISLFAKETLAKQELSNFLRTVFEMRIMECLPAVDFNNKQREHFNDYLNKVLGVHEGMEATFSEFAYVMKKRGVIAFQEFMDLMEALHNDFLFSQEGVLIEDRPRIFHYLEKVILALDHAIQSIRLYEEQLDVVLNIKTQVFGFFPQVISYRAEVEEIRSKMDSYSYLTVTSTDLKGREVPLGIIHAADLHKNILGTVSLRDFCNRDETKIPSYLEVISVIDHHKSVLSTLSPPVAYITDSQSSNALVAELSFIINDNYSTGGMTFDEIEKQMATVGKDLSLPSNKRIMQRLLQRHTVAAKKMPFYVSPEREFVEYLHFLYAILDDTDLLTKITRRDVECVLSLLNRMKSIMLKQEVEVVAFDDLPRDESFNSAAARRLLQNDDLYSLYKSIYLSKEEAVAHNLKLCAEGKLSSIFVDTKEQNGCCRIGQTKMFAANIPIYEKLAPPIRIFWFEESRLINKEKPEIDLYIHMISTIPGAEDVYAAAAKAYAHQDELWIWVPDTESGIEHLKNFLSGFKNSPAVLNNTFEVELEGANADILQQVFRESFVPVKIKATKKGNLPIAILRYKAGLLNSRKGAISPYLPRLP